MRDPRPPLANFKRKEGDCVSCLEERDKLVKKEKNRLTKLFVDIPPTKKKIVEGLIIQAARLRVLLNENWKDITKNGDYEMFSQSPNQQEYERKRPVAELYNSRDTSYQRVIKQLIDLLPESAKVDINDSSDLI